MYLRTLGGLALQGTAYSRPKSLVLLAYLGLEGERARHFLSEVFFGRAADPLGSLRTTVRRLRQEAPGALETDGDRLRASVICDASHMLSHLDAGELEASVELYTGPFLAGVHLPDAGVQLEDWIFATREFLAAQVRGALLTLAERAAARGDFAAGATLAERACWLPGAADPEPEQFTRLLTVLMAGQSPLFGRLRQQARDYEIGLTLTPDEARQALFKWQPQAARLRPGLPLRGTSFVGREEERAELLRSLARPEVRLLTLVGPGGIGKTRLALEVAQAAQQQGEAVFISLEAAVSLGPLPGAIADALGLTLPAEQPPFKALLSALGTRPILLVLDSAEHLLVGAPYLTTLLLACPGVRLLVTSRERLGLEDEWALTLGGLGLPAAGASFEAAIEAEAIHLFAQRAKRARLSFDLTTDDLPPVSRIGELVGGSPLGLELAAAWVKLMSPAEIAEEIGRSLNFLEAAGGDFPARHHSVRAVFEQTWARLTSAEAQVFARLSVFRGGFTREAAGAVAGASLPLLAALVDKSLIRVVEHGRFDIHALLQQFARERLAGQAQDEQQVLDVHGAYFLNLCQSFAEAIRHNQEEKRWLERMDQDIENVRAALDVWLERGQAEMALRCSLALRNFWARTGRTREARTWFALGMAHQVVTQRTLEATLLCDGEMAMHMHDYAVARAQLQMSLSLTESRAGTSPLTVLLLGSVHHSLGELDASSLHYERALRDFHAAGVQVGVAASLNNLGTVQMARGDLQAALKTFEEALQVKREVGGDFDSVLNNLGQLNRRLGRPEAAAMYFRQTLQGLTSRGFYNHVPEALEGLGLTTSELGDPRRAAVLLGAGEAQREALNTNLTSEEWDRLTHELAPIRCALHEREFADAWNEGRAMTLEQATAYALETQP
ncbi:ATP-binding protein [Deinococcus radiopugnans]|uniref:ATPase n=2 Tax=Deinococcus radiopugnans TaxID=57497 RepID=A0A5C4XVY1_9DEIO|nr:tetratricopeptide repeat protein [Deinococcus radiopugnans]MBB6018581.1 putative ATPase [Deinococcus radiopugnans ATCC 19172]TNM67283.1 tetratricopeptide repeat protein [Deinococcus radiopugnans ATCC 19172]